MQKERTSLTDTHWTSSIDSSSRFLALGKTCVVLLIERLFMGLFLVVVVVEK